MPVTAIALAVMLGAGTGVAPVRGEAPPGARSPADEAFLEDLSHRAFLFFWEQTDPATGDVNAKDISVELVKGATETFFKAWPVS